MAGQDAAPFHASAARLVVALALGLAPAGMALGVPQEAATGEQESAISEQEAATGEQETTTAEPQAAGEPAAETTEPIGLTAEQDPRIELYVQKCASCHTVGKGDRVGPDLSGVHERRDAAWLASMIQTPSAFLSRDADARALLAEYAGVKMPDLGLTSAQVADLIDLITVCSEVPCELAGKFVPVAEATEDDILRGQSLFLGVEALTGGGIACISCHTVTGAQTPVPGGNLGADLTHTFARLGDEGLDAALRNPTFAVMNKVFTDHPLEAEEALALRAFLNAANSGLGEDNAALSLPLFGVLVAATVLILLNALWARRLRGVRQPLTARGIARADLMRRSQKS